jgi:putative transposase
MKRSKYTDEQILAIVKEGEAGRKVADLCRTHGITERDCGRSTLFTSPRNRSRVAGGKL